MRFGSVVLQPRQRVGAGVLSRCQAAAMRVKKRFTVWPRGLALALRLAAAGMAAARRRLGSL